MHLVIVAIEGLSYEQFVIALERTNLTHLKALSRHSAFLPISFPPPAFSVSRWTSVATGMFADKHGVLHPLDVIPGTELATASSNSTVRVPTLWTVADREKIPTAVVGW